MDLTGALWRKSSRSSNNQGACVEIAPLPGVVAVRDSKNPDGPALTFTYATWRTFAATLKKT